MYIYNRLLTYQGEEEVILVDDKCKRINNDAFKSCHNARIIYLPESIDKIEDNAFDGSNIEILIIAGKYTQWHPHLYDGVKEIYIYAEKDSNIMRSVSPFELQSNLYLKNINDLDIVINPKIDLEKLSKICYQNMDSQSDEELIPKPYGWNKEIYEKR
jgi:hypothetical protein